MAYFKKKPVVIEAIQLLKGMDICSPSWWAKAIQSNVVTLHGFGKFTRDVLSVNIHTREGVMCGSEGDWIIKGVTGELYPCKPAIFTATYDQVSE